MAANETDNVEPVLLSKEDMDASALRQEQKKSLEWAIEKLNEADDILSKKIQSARQIQEVEDFLANMQISRDEAKGIIDNAKSQLKALSLDEDDKHQTLAEMLEDQKGLEVKIRTANERLIKLEAEEKRSYDEPQRGPQPSPDFQDNLIPMPAEDVEEDPELEVYEPSEEVLEKQKLFESALLDLKAERSEAAETPTTSEEAPILEKEQSVSSSQSLMQRPRRKQNKAFYKPTSNYISKKKKTTQLIRKASNKPMDYDTSIREMEPVEAASSESHLAVMYCRPETKKLVVEVAHELGLSPNELLDRGISSVARMILRNNGKVTFPIEVQQVDLGE